MNQQQATNNNSSRDDLCYHHFTLTFDPKEICNKFKNVKFVLVAGCARRAHEHAKYLLNNLEPELLSESSESLGTKSGDSGARATALQKKVAELELLTKDSSRFSLFKLGPILLANHGMGPASMSIALHELFLMCQQSKTIDKITLLRFGTCGGLGVEPGTICITNRAFDPLFNEFVELKICLKSVRRSTKVDTRVAKELAEAKVNDDNDEHELQHELGGKFQIKMGATMGTNDFYEEQGRTNGAICEHTQEDKRLFLEKCHQMGVINMEMEANHLAAMCNKLSVPFGVVDVALTNRLLDDRVLLNSKEMAQFERRLFWIILQFIRKRLSMERCSNGIVSGNNGNKY